MAPIEVKSGRDYATHSALSVFVKNEAYRVKHGYVLSNEREVLMKGKLFFFILREPTRRAAPDSGESFLQRKGRGEHFAFDGGMHRPFKAPWPDADGSGSWLGWDRLGGAVCAGYDRRA